jgi:hypothetical protein
MSDNIQDVEFTEVTKDKDIKYLYLAIAEKQDGERIYGTLHDSWKAAEESAREMCREINTHMKDWRVLPTVLDLEYLPDEPI